MPVLVNRLKSRSPFWLETSNIINFSVFYEWRNVWSNIQLFNKDLIEDLTKKVIGIEHPRCVWV